MRMPIYTTNSSNTLWKKDAGPTCTRLCPVWGNADGEMSIAIHSNHLIVTDNLHAALQRLLNHAFARILWVDAICINQEDERKKEHPLPFMAHIHGLVNRVVAWLGPAADGSEQVFRLLQTAAQETEFPAPGEKQFIDLAFLTLPKRSWFRRIWVCCCAIRSVCVFC